MVFGKKGGDAVPATGGSAFGSTTFAWDDKDKQPAPGVFNVLWKAPRQIRLNDNIVVREDEIAVFYRDGKALTYFDQPNRYALTDFNAPIVGNLLKFFTGVTQGQRSTTCRSDTWTGSSGARSRTSSPTRPSAL